LAKDGRFGPPPTHPAGWYQDPSNPNGLRYWTGSAWTDDHGPMPVMTMTAQGAIDAETMITHTLPLAQFADAVQLVRDREGLKVQVNPAL